MKRKLEIGDKIAAVNARTHDAESIRQVTRVTDTMAFCKVVRGENSYELKFNREVPEGGIFFQKGDTSWNRTLYRLASETDFQQVREGNLRAKASRIDWQQVGIEKIEQALKLLEQ